MAMAASVSRIFSFILHSPLRKARSQGDLDRGSHGGWQGSTDTGGGGSLPLSCSQGLFRQVRKAYQSCLVVDG